MVCRSGYLHTVFYLAVPGRVFCRQGGARAAAMAGYAVRNALVSMLLGTLLVLVLCPGGYAGLKSILADLEEGNVEKAVTALKTNMAKGDVMEEVKEETKESNPLFVSKREYNKVKQELDEWANRPLKVIEYVTPGSSC